MTLSVKEIIAHLADSSLPIRNTGLAELSNLKPEELTTLKKGWTTISPRRRLETVRRLAEMTEENLEFNFDAIFRSLLSDDDAEVRSTAVSGLWENDDATLIDPFIKMVEQDSSAEVQAAAAAALGKYAILAEYERLRPVYKERITKTLFSVINDTKRPVEVRRRALEAVSPLTLPGVTKAIANAYKSGDASLKNSAMYAMGKNCDTLWLPLLVAELENTDAETRYEAASSLGELGEEEAVPHLAKHLSDRDRDVRLAVIQALGQIGGALAKNYLKKCLASTNVKPSVRRLKPPLRSLRAMKTP